MRITLARKPRAGAFPAGAHKAGPDRFCAAPLRYVMTRLFRRQRRCVDEGEDRTGYDPSLTGHA